MRVLTVGNLYPPHGRGGYEAVWRSFAAHLRARGDSVRVLCSDARLGDAGAEEDPDVHRDLRWYWREGAWLSPGPLAALATERHNARVLRRHLADFSPAAVMWWSMGGMSLSLIDRARRAGIPAVGVVHDGWLAYGPERDAWARRTRRRPDLAGAGVWTFNSAATLERARADGWRLGDPIVIHPGIDPARFAPAGQRPWSWRLAYVGRVDPQKGVETLIEALAQLPPEASARIAGPVDEQELERLRGVAARHGVAERVQFTGPLPAEEIPRAYADADAVAFPVTWLEPFGLVPLEAMATGRPVVATGTGGSAEYLRDGANSLLFAPGDAGALAAALRRLAGDAELRERLRSEGLRTAAHFTEEAFNSRLEDVLRDAVAPVGGILRARS
jgi:glycosyltransferase involved in cell wall biosynthesis